MKQKSLLFAIFLTLSWNGDCQSIDSLVEIPVPKYVLWRMFHDIDLGKSCDSLQNYQFEVIQKAVWTIQTQDSLLNIRAETIDNYSKKEDIWRSLYNNQKAQTKIQEKEKRKWKLASIGGGVLIVLLVIL